MGRRRSEISIDPMNQSQDALGHLLPSEINSILLIDSVSL